MWFTGVEAIGRGGTGLSTIPTNGQLLIGNTTNNNYTLSTLTAGSGVTITNAPGSITVNATGSGGTVTSVGLSSPGVIYSVSGSPVTTSGTIALALISQAQNSVLAGPTSGSGSPSFRALVAADIPSLSGTYLPLAGGTMSGAIVLGTGGGSINGTAGAASGGAGGAGGTNVLQSNGGAGGSTTGIGGAGATIVMSGGAGGTSGNGGVAGGIVTSGSAASGATNGAAGGFIVTSASASHPGGSINTSGGTSGAGGAVNTSGGTSGAGGSIQTSNAGGSIDTTGNGSFQFGYAGNRITLQGTTGANGKFITLPAITGTVSLDSAMTSNSTSTATFNTNMQDETIYNSSGTTVASLTITLPSTNRLGQVVRYVTAAVTTTVTISGTVLIGAAVTTLGANGSIAYQSVSANGSWIRLY